jgi:hypothetical protein
MNRSIKKRISHWLGLACIFLAGASAVALGYALCGMLASGFSGDIEGHQSMRTYATGNQLRAEVKQALFHWRYLKAYSIHFEGPFFQTNADQRLAIHVIGLRTDDRKHRPLIFEQVAYSNLDLSLIVAQNHLILPQTQKQQQPDCSAADPKQPVWNPLIFRLHATPNRLSAALRYRQLYTVQNQFISLMQSSCLRDAGTVLKDTLFSSISCPRPLVLRQLRVGALDFAFGLNGVCRLRTRHCAGTLAEYFEVAFADLDIQPHLELVQSHRPVQQRGYSFLPAFVNLTFHWIASGHCKPIIPRLANGGSSQKPA